MALNPSLFTSSKDDWETPDDLFDQLDAEFGFDWDCASTAGNCKLAGTFLAASYYGPDHDHPGYHNAFAVSWDCFESGWLNPPYGRGIGAWVQKAAEAVQAEDGPNVVVVLVPARPDTQWWCRWATQADEIRYIEGRLTFKGAPSAAPFPSALLVFRRRYATPYNYHL